VLFISCLCAIHVARNASAATRVNSRDVQHAVVAAARAPTKEQFDALLEELRQTGAERDGMFEGELVYQWLKVRACVARTRARSSRCRDSQFFNALS
jgi:hypothetical protein